MKTTPVTPADLAASVLSVPPLARNANFAIDKAENVKPRDVYAQSFDIRDIRYWIANEPQFGKQAVYLDDANIVAELPSAAQLAAYKAEGINIVAPPLFALLDVDGGGNIVPSRYARQARAAGLDIITWTLERSGILAEGRDDFYLQTFRPAIATRRPSAPITVRS